MFVLHTRENARSVLLWYFHADSIRFSDALCHPIKQYSHHNYIQYVENAIRYGRSSALSLWSVTNFASSTAVGSGPIVSHGEKRNDTRAVVHSLYLLRGEGSLENFKLLNVKYHFILEQTIHK